MPTCKDHGQLVQKVVDMHTSLCIGFKATYIALAAIGSVMTAILVVLIMTLSSYKAMGVRLDHSDKQAHEMKESLKALNTPNLINNSRTASRF
jgi:hypothetical protein